jgi:hypothetical protein
MKTFNELRKINVNEKIEKKGKLSYLSWAWAVDYLLQEDPSATWEFPDPVFYGETAMVFCNVTAFGKTMKMHLPVMDNMNKSITLPDSRKISDSQMRCLAKCIATFGIGLYVYNGEDLPEEDKPDLTSLMADHLIAIQDATDQDSLKKAYQLAYKACGSDANWQKKVIAVKDEKKASLA